MDKSYHLRLGRIELVDQIAVLYNAVDSVDNPDHTPLDGSFFARSYNRKGFDIRTDLVPAYTIDGILIGTGTIFLYDTPTGCFGVLNIRVHPQHRKRGVRGEIYNALFSRTQEKGASSERCYVPSYRAYTRSFVENRGFGKEEEWKKLVQLPIQDMTLKEITGFKIRTADIDT